MRLKDLAEKIAPNSFISELVREWTDRYGPNTPVVVQKAMHTDFWPIRELAEKPALWRKSVWKISVPEQYAIVYGTEGTKTGANIARIAARRDLSIDPEFFAKVWKNDMKRELAIARDYYLNVWGFDPVKIVRFREDLWAYVLEDGFPLDAPGDENLDDQGVTLWARVEVDSYSATRNQLVFKRDGEESAVACIHSVVYRAPVDEVAKMSDDEQADLAISTEGNPALLSPLEHFAALRSFAAGLTEVGVLNALSSPREYGISPILADQIETALRQIDRPRKPLIPILTREYGSLRPSGAKLNDPIEVTRMIGNRDEVDSATCDHEFSDFLIVEGGAVKRACVKCGACTLPTWLEKLALLSTFIAIVEGANTRDPEDCTHLFGSFSDVPSGYRYCIYCGARNLVGWLSDAGRGAKVILGEESWLSGFGAWMMEMYWNA